MKAKKSKQKTSNKPLFMTGLVLLFSSYFVFADRYGELELFARVLNLIEQNYFKPLGVKTLVHGAIRGLLREIDPHSYFLTPENLALVTETTKGSRYGIGVEIEKVEGSLMILSVISNSPAEKAGLKRGDRLISVDGETVKHLTADEFLQKIRGAKTRTLTISRKNKIGSLTIRIKPEKLQIKSVQFQKLENGQLYIRIFLFTRTTLSELNVILKKFRPWEGLLLDLRGNPGGVFEQAVKVADLFIDQGSIVHFKTRAKKQPRSFAAMRSNTLPDFPLVVLMDEYSASASEVLAGALRDHKRALLVGRKSFGKGSVQNLFHMKNNYGLKLTVGEYHTPSGQSIHGKGIEPHISINKPAGDQVSSGFMSKRILEDPEVIQALKYLNAFKAKAEKFL